MKARKKKRKEKERKRKEKGEKRREKEKGKVGGRGNLPPALISFASTIFT